MSDYLETGPDSLDSLFSSTLDCDSSGSSSKASAPVLSNPTSSPSALCLGSGLQWNGTFSVGGDPARCVKCGSRGPHIEGKIESSDLDGLIHNIMEIADCQQENCFWRSHVPLLVGHVVALTGGGTSRWLDAIRLFREDSVFCELILTVINSCADAVQAPTLLFLSTRPFLIIEDWLGLLL